MTAILEGSFYCLIWGLHLWIYLIIVGMLENVMLNLRQPFASKLGARIASQNIMC